jgi:hypothetical protein
MADEQRSHDPALRAVDVIRLVANECAPYLREDDLLSMLFDCYWERAEATDPSDRRAVLDIVGQILLNSSFPECKWTGLLSPYLDAAGSVRRLLEPSIKAERLDEVLASYRERLEGLQPQGPRDMIGILELAAEIRDECPESLRIK